MLACQPTVRYVLPRACREELSKVNIFNRKIRKEREDFQTEITDRVKQLSISFNTFIYFLHSAHLISIHLLLIFFKEYWGPDWLRVRLNYQVHIKLARQPRGYIYMSSSLTARCTKKDIFHDGIFSWIFSFIVSFVWIWICQKFMWQIWYCKYLWKNKMEIKV